MAMSFELHPDGRRCTIRLTGTIVLRDLVAGIEAQLAAGAWTRETVVDTTGADRIDTLYPDTQHVVGLLRSRGAALPPRGPVVLIVGDNAAIFGTARQYQMMATESAGLRVEIVRSVEEIDAAFTRLTRAT
jgi:hypothetical protein